MSGGNAVCCVETVNRLYTDASAVSVASLVLDVVCLLRLLAWLSLCVVSMQATVAHLN